MTPTTEHGPDGPAGVMSLERKLPVLMTALLAVILAASLWITHRTLTRADERSSTERLERAARQVAELLEGSVEQRSAITHRWARDETLRRALTGPDAPDSAELHDALVALDPAADTAFTIELRDASGRRVAYAGVDAGDSASRWLPLEEPIGEARPDAGGDGESAVFGPLHAIGERVYFWVAAPIQDRGRTVGWIAQRRRTGGNSEASSAITDLIGENIALYLHNRSGDFWMRSPGLVASAPLARDSGSTGVVHTRRRAGTTLVGEAGIGGTPWVLTLEVPLAIVHAQGHDTLLTLVMLSLALMVVGALAAWIISRRITRPLVSLTTAAEAIARGEYERRVAVRGDQEVARLAAAFNQMASDVADSRAELEKRIAEAERANRAKSDFLAVMSHELRTPLNAIGGYAQLLDLGIHGSLNDAQRDAIARLSRSQAHLLALINDVLNFARIDAGQVLYAMEDVLIAELLGGLEPMIAPQVEGKGLAFVLHPCDPRATARADRDKLRQVLLNLLTNAIKFTPRGGRIEIDCALDAEAVHLRVSDNGIGIPADRLEAIFEPFVQLDRSLSHPHEGVGLGLAISRDLARGMGGDLLVESREGRGSVFTVVLHAGAPWSAARGAEPGESARERALASEQM